MAQFSYEDILKQPYPNPDVERDFPDKVLRAAQFAPFAALTGHDAAVAETARLTEKRQELNEDAKAELDQKIRMLDDAIGGCQEVTVTYFVPDEKKEGGKYLRYTGVVTEIKDFERTLIFADGTVLDAEEIIAIEGPLYDEISQQNL